MGIQKYKSMEMRSNLDRFIKTRKTKKNQVGWIAEDVRRTTSLENVSKSGRHWKSNTRYSTQRSHSHRFGDLTFPRTCSPPPLAGSMLALHQSVGSTIPAPVFRKRNRKGRKGNISKECRGKWEQAISSKEPPLSPTTKRKVGSCTDLASPSSLSSSIPTNAHPTAYVENLPSGLEIDMNILFPESSLNVPQLPTLPSSSRLEGFADLFGLGSPTESNCSGFSAPSATPVVTANPTLWGSVGSATSHSINSTSPISLGPSSFSPYALDPLSIAGISNEGLQVQLPTPQDMLTSPWSAVSDFTSLPTFPLPLGASTSSIPQPAHPLGPTNEPGNSSTTLTPTMEAMAPSLIEEFTSQTTTTSPSHTSNSRVPLESFHTGQLQGGPTLSLTGNHLKVGSGPIRQLSATDMAYELLKDYL